MNLSSQYTESDSRQNENTSQANTSNADEIHPQLDSSNTSVRQAEHTHTTADTHEGMTGSGPKKTKIGASGVTTFMDEGEGLGADLKATGEAPIMIGDSKALKQFDGVRAGSNPDDSSVIDETNDLPSEITFEKISVAKLRTQSVQSVLSTTSLRALTGFSQFALSQTEDYPNSQSYVNLQSHIQAPAVSTTAKKSTVEIGTKMPFYVGSVSGSHDDLTAQALKKLNFNPIFDEENQQAAILGSTLFIPNTTGGNYTPAQVDLSSFASLTRQPISHRQTPVSNQSSETLSSLASRLTIQQRGGLAVNTAPPQGLTQRFPLAVSMYELNSYSIPSPAAASRMGNRPNSSTTQLAQYQMNTTVFNPTPVLSQGQNQNQIQGVFGNGTQPTQKSPLQSVAASLNAPIHSQAQIQPQNTEQPQVALSGAQPPNGTKNGQSQTAQSLGGMQNRLSRSLQSSPGHFSPGPPFHPAAPSYNLPADPKPHSPMEEPRAPAKSLQQMKDPRKPMYLPAVLRPPPEMSIDVNSNLPPQNQRHPELEGSNPQEGLGPRRPQNPGQNFHNTLIASTLRKQTLTSASSVRSVSLISTLREEQPTRNHWRKNESRGSCSYCLKQFTFFTRRHHCRRCGDLFCADHVSHSVNLDYEAQFTLGGVGCLSKVCDWCIRDYEGFAQLALEDMKREQEEILAKRQQLQQRRQLVAPGKEGPRRDRQYSVVGDNTGVIPADWSWSSF
ncbi:hypothetical protein BABINDRAFT_149083 [Babjeviella inositovora NRRL Y-12698]|uniref:FYVE-type domain-containing protein n=1 Tax=Babjeviella inositovora NRRL Y-12698 TaxID=984486 RepID=A0A1E3QND9_9ASCO|nr:uncharacterized protein BABINDRAFT_149083 [Babjeviella inositovora NRRL Y-12698]ODQ79158.1 hypothetical protein BABINDRAFT_149083 [Babjeviella inositovora NRRL Y-12698]